jgi:hypothetical protein
MNWSYGITTCGNRYSTTLPRTIESLSNGGFTNPILFVDNPLDLDWDKFELEVVKRSGKVNAFSNIFLAITELVLRFPLVDRYALFQDDIICGKNLKSYLEKFYPEKGYLNLYLFPSNAELAKGNGWYLSNQRGLSACGLVFSRDVILNFWRSDYMINRPRDARRGWKSIDGGIVSALKNLGISEWVHYPSLLQHIGTESIIGNKTHAQGVGFLGESHDWNN